MRHYWSLEDVNLKDSWLTIGTFDGVHRGHQEIVQKLASGAHKAGAKAVVLTFFPTPAIVLGKRKDPVYLNTPDERAALLGEFGADIVVTYPFTPRTATTPARKFISLLKKQLSMSHLLIGPDFALGRDRGGNIQKLAELGAEFNYTLATIPPVKLLNGVVSSSRIRAALSAGDLDQVNLLLGRPYFVTGHVVPGDGRGKTIGIPTANLSLWMNRALPKSGVYVSLAMVNGQAFDSVTNVGVRPTFANGSPNPQVETHLLNFSDDIYGQEIQINFIDRLRDEQRFPDTDTLVAQIRRDISLARDKLSAKST
jgi:riboflavin kinase/FMN adenylyltransferase